MVVVVADVVTVVDVVGEVLVVAVVVAVVVGWHESKPSGHPPTSEASVHMTRSLNIIALHCPTPTPQLTSQDMRVVVVVEVVGVETVVAVVEIVSVVIGGVVGGVLVWQSLRLLLQLP